MYLSSGVKKIPINTSGFKRQAVKCTPKQQLVI